MHGLIVEIGKYVVVGVFGYFVAYFTGIRALKKGVQCLLRRTLRQDYRYFKKEGCTFAMKDDFEAMYTAYHALGKNGVMDATYEKVKQINARVDDV